MESSEIEVAQLTGHQEPADTNLHPAAMDSQAKQIQEAVQLIRSRTKVKPKVGLVLGSGLGTLGDQIENAAAIPYEEVPHFPTSTVPGHAGKLVIGMLEGVPVLAMQGRFHYYEGYSMQQVTYPIRVMKALGIDQLLVTNAAGGLRAEWGVGTLMLIEDHLLLTGSHPLIGSNDERLGPRFPDLSQVYSKKMMQSAEQVASQNGIRLEKGVYAGLTGPSYETPAEIRMLRFLGADAVGMSTVPEVIVAGHGSMQVLGISCITNLAAGMSGQKLNHEEVVETTRRVNAEFTQLVRGIIKMIGA